MAVVNARCYGMKDKNNISEKKQYYWLIVLISYICLVI